MAAAINVPLSFRQQTPALQATYVKSLSDAIKSAPGGGHVKGRF